MLRLTHNANCLTVFCHIGSFQIAGLFEFLRHESVQVVFKDSVQLVKGRHH